MTMARQMKVVLLFIMVLHLDYHQHQIGQQNQIKQVHILAIQYQQQEMLMVMDIQM
jgi:hypothetical protein